MQINLESTDKHSIQAYDDKEIRVNSITYSSSLIISSQEIICPWPVTTLNQLDEQLIAPLLRHQPKIIIIGSTQQGQLAPIALLQKLSQQGIGLEAMSIGAACRTFNVLLSEQRDVVLGLILRGLVE